MINNQEHVSGSETEASDDIVIEARGVTKLYGTNKSEAMKMMKAGADKNDVYAKTGVTVALWDVNFKIKRGEIFVIIGLSGSGKSTIIRQINMLNRPSSGSILYTGQTFPRSAKKSCWIFGATRLRWCSKALG